VVDLRRLRTISAQRVQWVQVRLPRTAPRSSQRHGEPAPLHTDLFSPQPTRSLRSLALALAHARRRSRFAPPQTPVRWTIAGASARLPRGRMRGRPSRGGAGSPRPRDLRGTVRCRCSGLIGGRSSTNRSVQNDEKRRRNANGRKPALQVVVGVLGVLDDLDTAVVHGVGVKSVVLHELFVVSFGRLSVFLPV